MGKYGARALSLWVDNVSAPLTSHLKKISFTFQVYYKHTTAFNFPKKEEKKIRIEYV